MLWLLFIGLFISIQTFAAYTNARGNVAFQSYLDLAELQGEAVSIVHPSLPGYIESCSGTIFKGGYILTAGHCVTDEQGKLLADPDRYIISHGLDKQNPDYISAARSVHLHPKYAILPNGGRSHDIAIINLGYSPNISKYGVLATMPPEVGDILTGFGYGIVGDNVRGITNKYNMKLVAYKTRVAGRFPNQVDLVNSFFDTTLPLAGIAASGDSGGGLKNTKGEIVAVTSSINQVPSTQAPTHMQIVDVTKVSDFIASSQAKVISAVWTGKGNTSDPANWKDGVVPHSTTDTSYDPATISDPTNIIADQDFSVSDLTLTHPNSSFTVNEGKTADFSYGLESKGRVTVNGTLRGTVLRIEGDYSSPSGTHLSGNGNIIIEKGTLQTSKFTMDGGRVFGNGSITTPIFVHKSGYLDPGTRTVAGTLTINGSYQQSGEDSAISINLFNDKTSDRLVVSQNSSSTLNFFLDFPDKIIPANTAYRIFTASSGNQPSQLSFGTNPLYSSTGSYLWQGDDLILIIGNLSLVGLSAQVVSDTRPDIYKGLQNLRASGASVPSSLFKTIRQMSHATFYTALSDFADPKLQKSLLKTFSNTSVQRLHRSERVGLFLEKKRQIFDLTSFNFISKNSFSGANIIAPENTHSPLSLFVSGELYDNMSNYKTQGMTFGGDYAENSTLLGISFHFKNQPLLSEINNPNAPPSEYHFNIYHAKRGALYFYDTALTHGRYEKDIFYNNIWGKWNACIHSHQTRLDNRLGLYKTDEKSFYLGYLGLSGAFSKTDPFATTISNSFFMNTTDSSLASLEGTIGIEGKTRLHFGDIIFEPTLSTSIGIPLFEVFNSPSNHFKEASDSSFQQDPFSLDKTNLALNFTLRMYIPQNTILKIDLDRVKQCEDIYSKMFVSLNMKF